jgi:rhodanese-related sulfurtransferase
VPVPAALRTLDFDNAVAASGEGAAFVDLRGIDDYLDVHIPASLALTYEFGPGMAARARDCLPLDLPLIVQDAKGIDVVNAVASLRAKGFTVLGTVDDAITEWGQRRGTPASTDRLRSHARPEGIVLDIGDPGASRRDDDVHIPIEYLWNRAEKLAGRGRIVIAAGFGVRAALAIGILERVGIDELLFWSVQPAR